MNCFNNLISCGIDAAKSRFTDAKRNHLHGKKHFRKTFLFWDSWIKATTPEQENLFHVYA